MRGEGYFVRGGTIHVDGMVDGKRYRRSTGLTVCAKNISYVKKYHQKILNDIVKSSEKKTFVEFGLDVIRVGSGSRSRVYQRELEGKFKKEIVPYFRRYDFSEIKPLTIDRWINVLYNKYSNNTVRKYANLLHNIMQKAVANDLCDKDPFLGINRLKRTPKQLRAIYSEDEIYKIISNAQGWFKVFATVAFGTAARTGELLALKKSDLDFDNRVIKISKSFSNRRLKETKTGVVRYVDMLDIVYDSLYNFCLDRKNEDFIFVNKDGEPYHESKNIIKYHFKPLLEKLNIEYKTLYASRHSFISLMLNKGMDLMWVQNMAGHSSSSTTLRHYAVFQNGDFKRLKKANNILKTPDFTAHATAHGGI